MRRLSVAALVFLAALNPLFAGETGSISGVIKDSQGGVLPGASVKVSGPQLPAGREATTTRNGVYLFPRLLPGVYRVEATLQGLGTAAREIQVSVDNDAQVDLILNPTVTETVEVVAEAPAVDLKSTEVNFNFTAAALKDLPLARNYSGAFQRIPGLADNGTNTPSAGGSRQENTYLMDGVNITNPGFGTLDFEVNELDIAEFNMKRGAISAEFGRAAGFVANAVSKAGTNTISGSARMEYRAIGLQADPKDKAFGAVPSEYLNPALGVGGPLIKDRVFWYGSARYFKTTTPDRVNRVGTALPDLVSDGRELYGKITAMPTQKHLVNISFRDRPAHTDNAGLGAGTAPSVATNDDSSTRVATASWAFFMTSRSNIELKYLYLKENNESDPVTELGYRPTWDPRNLAAMGLYPDPTQANLSIGAAEYFNRQNYRRQEIKGTFSQYFDLGKTNHQVKLGAGYEFGEEELSRLTNGWGSLANITVSGQPVVRARYYFEQPAQLGQGRTWSAFVQDSMTIGRRLTLNLGVLLNKDEFAQDLEGSGGCPTTFTVPGFSPGGAAPFETDGDRCTFIRFGWKDEIQPRLGLNFNLREGQGDKLYANYGRYYNMDQKSSARSLAPRRIYQYEARFNATTGALISDVPRASTSGKVADPDLKPTYNDEFLAGYATPIGKDWSLDVFYMYRNTKNFIEDVPTKLPDTGPYAAGNLPCNLFVGCQNAEAKRKYQAGTIEINRRMAGRWSANVSYTYSKFEGNVDFDYGYAIFNTSSFIQDGPGTNVQEPNRYGPLRQDRPHVFKVFANVTPFGQLMLGGYLRVQSGTPWNARGRDWEGSTLNNYGTGVAGDLEAPGTHRNPTWTNFDLLASYRFKLGDRSSVNAEARLFNVFNTQTVLSVDSQRYLDLKTVSSPPYFAPYTDPNPLFGTPNSYATPRRLVLSATFAF